jgi:hypothetical protein
MKSRFALVLLLLLALSASSLPASAQSGNWSAPFELSPPVLAEPAPPETATPTIEATSAVSATDVLTGTTTPTSTPTSTPTATPTSTPTSTPSPLPSPAKGTELPAQSKQQQYGSSWFPDLAVGADGTVHVVWYSGIVSNDKETGSIDLLMYRELRDGQWSPFNNIFAPATGGYTVRNSIVAARDGRLHVILRGGTEIEYASAAQDQAWSAHAWTPLRGISSGGAYYTALAADSHGALHAFWSESVMEENAPADQECISCSDMIYRRSVDGGRTWSERVDLTRTKDGENRPQVKVDAKDHIHVVWDQGIDWYAPKAGVAKFGIYRRSDDGGLKWTTPVTFSLPSDAVQQTTLAVTPQGNPIVVYRGLKGRLYFQVSDDGGTTWSPSQEIPGVFARDERGNDLDRFSMETDSAGHVHLVMVGFPAAAEINYDDPPKLMHLTWDGNAWSPPDMIVDNELYPEWPAIAVSGGNQLHVVWYTRSKEDLFRSDKAHYRVWYSSRTVDAPAAQALTLFTPTPVPPTPPPPSPTPPPPSPTPLPPEVLNAPAPTSGPAWELPGILTILMALLPVVGLFAILGAVIWVKRRVASRRQRGRSARRGV